jgi:hypothetical protein
VSTERATFTLELRDGISAPAQDAVAELARLKEAMGAGVARLREMQAAMQRLRAGGVSPANESFQRLRSEIEAQKGANAALQQGILALGGSFEGAAGGSVRAKSGFERLILSMKAMGGPTGALGESFERLGRGISAAPLLVGGVALAVVLAAVAAAAIAVGIAAARAAVQLAQYAITSADARRTEMLRIEGLMTLREYQRGAAGSAVELIGAIDRVAASSAAGRDDVTRYGEQLYRAGLRGAELTEALEAVTDASSVQGEESARRLLGTMRAAHAAGRSVRGLAEDVRSRLGGVARRQALGLDVQMRHLRENVAHIFDGLGLDRFLRGMREVLQIFDQQHAVGRALAAIARVVFQPMLDGAGDAGPALRAFFEQLTIHALDFAIVVLRVRNGILRTFGRPTVTQVEAVRAAMLAATVTAVALGIALVPVAIGVIALVAALALLAAPLAIAIRGIMQADETLRAAGLTWTDAGRLLVDGFTNGITSRIEAARTAVTTLATQATDALRSALAIHSPSRVFAALGAEIPAGLAVGVEQGTPEARAAVNGVATLPSRSQAASRGPVIGALHIHIDGAFEGAREAAEGIHDELVRLLAGAGAEVGA